MIEDPKFFFEKIKNKESFALSRYGDGEAIVLGEVKKIDQISSLRHGVIFNPNESIDKVLSAQLYASLYYVSDDYYIGVPLPGHIEWTEIVNSIMRQKPPYLTKVDIFVGHRGELQLEFIDEFFKLVEEKNIKINWICNEVIKRNPPAFINKFFFIKDDAWKIEYKKILIELLTYVENKENELFLFSAGMFSNILIFYLWIMNKKNIYFDIGSALDPFTHEKYTRSYHTKYLERDLEERKKTFEKLANK